MINTIKEEFSSHLETINNVIGSMENDIEIASTIIVDALKNGNKVLLCGNGGSAADAQHIAAELTGRYKTERRGLPGIALTTDTSALTAIGNDYGFENVFAREIQAIATPADVLIAITTSGNSGNILKALEVAKEIKVPSFVLTGAGRGMLDDTVKTLNIPSTDTARIQECHILIGHIICGMVEETIFKNINS